MTEDTVLYRAYDAQGDLLYVGITRNWTSRLHTHSRQSAWVDDVVRLELDRHPTRKEAMESERRLIQTLAPKHNEVFLTVGKRRGPRLPGVQVDLAALVGARLNLGISQSEVARRVEMDRSHYSKLERGVPPRPSRPLLDRIAKVLGVDAAVLLAHR